MDTRHISDCVSNLILECAILNSDRNMGNNLCEMYGHAGHQKMDLDFIGSKIFLKLYYLKYQRWMRNY